MDTISKAGFSKTVINIPVKKDDSEEMTEEERGIRMKQFGIKYESQLKKFGMMQKYEDSRRYLMDNYHLVCEDTAHYLVVWCINLEMEKVILFIVHFVHAVKKKKNVMQL